MAEWIVTIVAIAGVIITLWQMSTSSAKSQQAIATKVEGLDKSQQAMTTNLETMDKSQQALDAKVSHLEADVADIKKTLGNGGYAGIKGEIQAMKVHCAGAMAQLNVQLTSHLKNDDKQ